MIGRDSDNDDETDRDTFLVYWHLTHHIHQLKHHFRIVVLIIANVNIHLLTDLNGTIFRLSNSASNMSYCIFLMFF